METITTIKYDVTEDQANNQELTFRLLDDNNNPTHVYKAHNLTEFIRMVTCKHLIESKKTGWVHPRNSFRVMGGVL